ncbi:MAG: hypothetical protein ACR2QC_01520 [Gammaproteobacteria bacterium]
MTTDLKVVDDAKRELQTKKEKSADNDGIFNARNVCVNLEGLMRKVTKEECTPSTVNAACNCAARITDLLRVHLEAQRLKKKVK